MSLCRVRIAQRGEFAENHQEVLEYLCRIQDVLAQTTFENRQLLGRESDLHAVPKEDPISRSIDSYQVIDNMHRGGNEL